MKQEGNPTLHDEPVVTPRPQSRSSGPFSHKSTKRSHLYKQRKSPCPFRRSASSFAQWFAQERKSHKARDRGSYSHRAAEALCSPRGALQAASVEAWCSGTTTLQTQMPDAASDGLDPLEVGGRGRLGRRDRQCRGSRG